MSANVESKNIKLTLAYDGTRYLGWQHTSVGPSIEGELKRVLEQVLQEKIRLQAASRTDAGVHAAGQVVNFFTKRNSDLPKLVYSLNCLLPKDIVIVEANEAPAQFHPTLDASGKEYWYRVCASRVQLPLQRHYVWHYPYALDLESMRLGAERFIGTHDFQAFCNAKKNEVYENHLCTIERLEIVPDEGNYLFKIAGNRFLYKMVRNLIGTLVYIGVGKMEESQIPQIIKSKSRPLAGLTAPAHGLTLQSVYFLPKYPE